VYSFLFLSYTKSLFKIAITFARTIQLLLKTKFQKNAKENVH